MKISRVRCQVLCLKNCYALGLGLLSLFLLLSLAACSSNVSAEPTPPTIHSGEDVCELCNMIISDERFAAGYITSDGQQHIFDDIGDMFQAHLAKGDEVIAFFVHNYENKTWVRAEKATFVHGQKVHTPMGSGIVAFESREQAQAFASEVGGQLMDFTEVSAYFKANPMPGGGHGMESNHTK